MTCAVAKFKVICPFGCGEQLHAKNSYEHLLSLCPRLAEYKERKKRKQERLAQIKKEFQPRKARGKGNKVNQGVYNTSHTQVGEKYGKILKGELKDDDD